MRKLAWMFVFLAAALAAGAQDVPKVEVFGGYQYFRVYPGLPQSVEVYHGWNASVAATVVKHFSLLADFSRTGSTVNGFHAHQFTALLGPQVEGHGKCLNPFAHVLVGLAHASTNVSGSGESSPAWAIGGGLDVSVHRHIAVRVAQLDMLQTRYSSQAQSNFRVSTGIVFKLGKR